MKKVIWSLLMLSGLACASLPAMVYANDAEVQSEETYSSENSGGDTGYSDSYNADMNDNYAPEGGMGEPMDEPMQGEEAPAEAH